MDIDVNESTSAFTSFERSFEMGFEFVNTHCVLPRQPALFLLPLPPDISTKNTRKIMHLEIQKGQSRGAGVCLIDR